MESATMRSMNEGDIWLSADMPFGLAKYHVKLVREEKEDTDPRQDFKKVAEIDVEMAAIEKGTNAQSELDDATGPAPDKVVKKAKLKEALTDESAPATETTEEGDKEEMDAEGSEESEEMPAEEMSADDAPAEEMSEEDAEPAAGEEKSDAPKEEN